MLTFQEINLTKGPGIKTELQSLGFPAVLKYLRDRGVSENDLDDLGLKILPASELLTRARGVTSVDDRLAVVFPHFNAKGDYIDWWSARLVDTGLKPAVVSFANLAPDKRGKMFCPPQEAPHAYLPPILDWSKIQRGDKIYIHESAIKAINGAKLGYWSVGLNGVWGWCSRKQGIMLVQELKDLPWKALDLNPVIVFDSNAEDNWDVQTAIGRLAAKLLEITTRQAGHILLPRGPDGKHWGFDDFVQSAGSEKATAYLEGDPTPVEIGGVELLKLQLNEEVAVVRSLGRVAQQSDGTLMTRAVFTDVNYAHFTATVETDKGDKVVNVPKLWLSDTRRVEVHALTYMPGSDRIAGGDLNLWRGMALDPKPGPVERWLELLRRNVLDEKLRTWVLKWMAFPLQNLGSKLTTYIHLFGPPGVGKQAVLRPLMRIYGEHNAIIIGKEHLESSFNSLYANKQFINVDEIHGGAGGAGLIVANKLKKLVTQTTLPVNSKGQPEYEVPNCANVVTTANYSDAIHLDDDDRRAAVIRFGTRGAGYDKSFWEGYFKWINGEGAAAVYAYLLELDVSGFDPGGWAPMTEEKVEVTRATRRVDEQWVNMLWEDPDQVLPPMLSSRCLFDTGELAQYCFGDDPQGVTPSKKNMLGIKLHSAGFPKIEIKLDGKKVRYWIVRKRDDAWDGDKARAHLKAHRASKVTK